MNFAQTIIEFLGLQDVTITDLKIFKKQRKIEIKVKQKRSCCFCPQCGLQFHQVKDWDRTSVARSEQAQEWVTVEEIGKQFIKVFPKSLDDADPFWDSPEEGFIRCYTTRFLQRVCLPLGIIEEAKTDSPFLNMKDKFKVTSFFERTFSFDKNF